MATKVFMEALSPTMEEGRVLSWHKREGDAVAEGDLLAEVETDKAVMELQARGSGVLRRIVAPAGATVEVGSLVAVIATADEDIGDVGAAAALAAKPSAEGEAPAAPSDAGEPRPKPAASAGPSEQPRPADGGRIKASPLARRIAAERGLDLASISGSGPGGRIIKRDVERAPAAVASALPAAGERDAGYEDVQPGQLRKTIAKRLVQSLGPIPHFFLTSEIDMARVAEARDALNALDDGPRVSYNDIVLKVVAVALRQHRECNAWWLDGTIRYFNDIHLSMAVAIDDGLITPVIRHADRKSLRDIATEARALVERARERKLAPEEYTGGTFSISNLGMFDIDEFTAVINPPEAGILAVGSVVDKPVVADGQLVIGKRMRVTMSCDHRVIDGATGARFLRTVRTMLENPLAIIW